MRVRLSYSASATRGGHPSPSMYGLLCSKEKIEWIGCPHGDRKSVKAEAARAAKRYGWILEKPVNDPFKGKRVLP